MHDTSGVRHYITEGIGEVERLAAEIARGKGGREVALVKTKLEEALLWLDAAAKAIDKRD